MTNTNPLPLVVKDLTFRYKLREEPAIRDICFEVHPGEVMLIAGASGCGKTTLMRCINGLIPLTYSGELSGSIEIFGKDARSLSMAELSQTIGTMLQDPERQIVGSYVLNEVAFGLENLGIERKEILRRVDEALDRLGILHLRDRETFSISGGEKQKLALAGVLAMQPRILLLDEPLANLDPMSAHEALKVFRGLADDGISVMIVEHRVEDVISISPDVVLYMEDGQITQTGSVADIMEVVDYGRIKLPAEVIIRRAKTQPEPQFMPAVQKQTDNELVRFEDVSFRYKPDQPDVLHHVNFNIHQGDIIAILGHNGAGKTTLVKHTLGLLKPTGGRVLLEGKDTHDLSVAQAAHTVGYVFQSPTQMLFAPSVAEELAFGPKNLGTPEAEIAGNVQWAIETVHMEAELTTPPLALSFGQQKRISIAAVLAMKSRILMMDEPTAGQDYWNYMAFMDAILQMPGFDSVLFITHDVDLAVIFANRVLLLNAGQVVADGTPQEVLADDEVLARSRVLSTSLLRLNRKHFPSTGRFMRAESLAHQLSA